MTNWVSKSGGSWGDGSNWTGGAVPGASDDVSIDVANIIVTVGTGVAALANSVTVSLSELDISGGSLLTNAMTFQDNAIFEIDSGSVTTTTLTTVSAATVLTGGTLYTVGGASFGGTVSQSAGTFTMGGLGANFNGALSQTGGTMDVLLGTLTIDAGSSLAGTIVGDGALSIADGSSYINKGFVCTVNSISVGSQGGKLGFDINFVYGGNFTQEQGGVLDLFGHTLTLNGASTLLGVTGYGTVVDAGTMSLGAGPAQTYLDNGLILDVTGNLTQSGNIALGAADAGAKVDILKHGTYSINGDWSVANPSSIGSMANAGMLVKTGGGLAAVIDCSLSNTGVIDVATGELLLNGLVNAVAGTVSGAGTLAIAGGQTTLGGKVALKQDSLDQQSGNLVINKALSYAGEWDQTGGVLNLNNSTVKLTLSGQSDFSGGTLSGYGGTIVLSGPSQMGDMTFGGPNLLEVAGTLDQTNTINFGVSSNPVASILSGAAWLLQGNGAVGDNSINGFFGLIENAGTFGVTNSGGDAVVQPVMVNTGTIVANNGTLTLAGQGNELGGKITGTGLVDAEGTTTLESGLVLSVAQFNLGGTTILNANQSYANAFSMNQDTLDLNGETLALTGAASFDIASLAGPGTLTSSGNSVLNTVDIQGGATMVLTGTAEQAGPGGAVTVDGLLSIGAHASYTLDDDLSIFGAGELLVQGVLTASATGTSTISPYLMLTGQLAVNDQHVVLIGGATIGGTVSGGGTLELGPSTTDYTVAAGAKLQSSGLQLDYNAVLALSASATFAGNFTQLTNSTIDANRDTLTLSGTTTLANGAIEGPGTVVVAGTGVIGGEYVYAGAVLEITGQSDQIGSIIVGEGGSGTTPPSTAELLVAAGATYTLDKLASITGNGTLAVAGTLAASSNTTLSLGPTIVDTGTIAANLGTVSVLQAVSGTGSFLIGSQGVLDFGVASTIGLATGVNFTSGGGELLIENLTSFQASLENFATADVIAFSGLSGSLTLTEDGTQKLVTITDVGGSAITLHFTAAQNLSNFGTTTVNGLDAIYHK